MASTPVTTAAASETPRVTLPRPEPPRLHSGKTFFWGIVLILAVGFLAWLLIGYFGTGSFEDLDQKRVKERQVILQKRNDEDAKLLNDPPSYFDKDKGKIRVPITEAMKLALIALQANKPHAMYPLTDSPPQPAAAPTSPDKGAGSPKDGSINPSASNPTLPQASPGASPAAASSPVPTPVPPSTMSTPAPAGAPTPGATPQVGTAATSTPTPPPATTNNALNPGNPPPNGAQPQPSPAAPGNTETNGGSPTPSGAQGQPLTSPTPPAAPSENTPSPNPQEPGATPGGTP